MDPIRVFIGTDDTQTVPTAVLKHSILTRTSAPVVFHELHNLNTGLENEFYTGFSFYRWGIPHACAFDGQAIYIDADVVVLCDINEVWQLPLSGHSHLVRPRPRFKFDRFRIKRLGGAYASVMVIDCARARHWDFRAWCERAATDKQFYRDIMWCMPGSETAKLRGDLPAVYNDLDYHEQNLTKIIHYTDLPNQPWKRPGHRYEYVFRRALREAYLAGVVDLPMVKTDIERGYIHEEMVTWVVEEPTQS